jgi:probable HAF family extracellular repeat protein
MSEIANLLFSLLFVLCSFLFSRPAFSQDGSPNGTCSFQTLHLPGNAAGFDTVEAINDIGAIVGTATPANEQTFNAFLFFNGKFTPFMFPGSLRTAAHDINNHAQIVGEYADRLDNLHGFVVHSGGFRTIDVPGTSFTVVEGINDFGDMVGIFLNDSNQGFATSFLLHKGKFTKFSFPGADPGTTGAMSINNSGVIVGTYLLKSDRHGFMVKNGHFSSIDFPGAAETQVFKISNDGDIVGTYSMPFGVSNGFSFANGKFKTINQPNTSFNAVRGVNSHDQIVGTMPYKASCQNVF